MMEGRITPPVPFRQSLLAGLPGGLGLGVIALGTVLVAIVSLLLTEVVGVPVDRSLMLLAPGLCLLLVVVFTVSERMWVYMAVLSHVFFVGAQRDALGAGEIAFGIINLGGLALWFVREMALRRNHIIESGFDLLFVSFMVVGTISTLIASVLHGGDLLQYVKEYGVVLDLLLYFPLKRVTTRPRDVVAILCIFFVIGAIGGSVSLLTYRERLTNAVFQWQITSSRSNLQGAEFTAQAVLVLGATLFAYARRWWMQLLALGVTGAGLVFLLVSFSRGPIVAAVFAVMIMASLSPLRQGLRAVGALLLALMVGAAVAFIMFPNLASNLGKALADRVATVASAGTDRSFNARVVESNTLLQRYIVHSPVIGAGFGVYYKFLDPLTNTTITYSFVHNGYVWALFKYGLPLALLLHVLLVYPLFRLLMRAPRRHEGFNRAVMAGAVGYTISSLVVHFTGNQFALFTTVLNIILCWTFFDYVRRQAIARDEAARLLAVRSQGSTAESTGGE